MDSKAKSETGGIPTPLRGPMTRVILVEDDEDTGQGLQAMLELRGHTVHWVRNGRGVQRVLDSHVPVDLVLTDILMPDMDGIETIQFLRKSHPTLPLIAMTAQRNTPYLRAALLFGARATLQKPFSGEELEAAIRMALEPLT